MIVTNKSVV